MNSFDAASLHWLNQFVARSVLFDRTAGYISDSYLFKGEFLMILIWWVWFSPSKPVRKNREIIVTTIFSAAAAIILGRTLAHFLPFRVRPLFDPLFHFPTDSAAQEHAKLRDWSAFPSDHAMLFAAMATGLVFASRRIGALAWAYWVIVIGFPRAYLGLHHPTDLIAGGALGATISWAANQARFRARLGRWPLVWADAHPGSFYACFFLFSFQLATMFDEPREIFHGIAKLLSR